MASKFAVRPGAHRRGWFALIVLATLSREAAVGQDDPDVLLSWNDLGMHCIDPDFSVFAILPPFNNVESQLLINGQLVTSGAGYLVSYAGLADATGSINTTSIGKTNFWEYVEELFGVALPPDVGLTGNPMPGPGNVPRPTVFDSTWNWFAAEGLPFTPLDDALAKNPYPLLRTTARNAGGQLLAETVTTVPNSQELQCRLCHASAQSPDARPTSGWAYDPDPLRDDRLNILLLHDDREAGNPLYAPALAAVGYHPDGLHATATVQGTPVLCARCHGSNALPGTGMEGIPMFTSAIHGVHAAVRRPDGVVLDDDPTRTSCYSCHPGFDTQCLRGAMGRAIGADGEFSMQCQSCHGGLAAVGDPGRIGWLEEPACQNCHTGTATQNSGAIRFTSAFDESGALRAPASDRFATTPDVPATGFSLYRFSTGHGDLQCAACHGPPHAIYPTGFANDNVQMESLQGHAGTLIECSTCHSNLEDDQVQGPHGMHPVGTKWVRDLHGDRAEGQGLNQCRACHGLDDRGTVLSYAQAERTINTVNFGIKDYWRGFRIGCYDCHDGPDGENPSSNRRPVVTDRMLAGATDQDLGLTLGGTDADGDSLELRIVAQPANGTVALDGFVATYRSRGGYVGADSFTYAAWDGKTNSNLGTVDVDVGPPDCGGSIVEYGFSCEGEGGFVPHLSMSGCPRPGETITLMLDNAHGGSLALLLAGVDRAAVDLRRGCVLRVDPALVISPLLPIAGSGPGNGTLVLEGALDPSFAGLTFTLQMYLYEPAIPGKWATTNGVEVNVE